MQHEVKILENKFKTVHFFSAETGTAVSVECLVCLGAYKGVVLGLLRSMLFFSNDVRVNKTAKRISNKGYVFQINCSGDNLHQQLIRSFVMYLVFNCMFNTLL